MARIARKNLDAMRKRDGGKFSFLRKGDGPLQINLCNFFKDIDIIFICFKYINILDAYFI